MALLATLMALAGFMCWAAHVPPQPWVNQDVAVNLFSGTQLLSGARLYVDWHDTNPPAIHVWSALIVGLSRWIGQSAVLTYHLSMVTVFGMSASLLIRNIGTSKPHAVAIFTLAFGVILLSPTLLRFDDFGQREQIWLILFFPLLLLRVYSLNESSGHAAVHAGLLGFASGFKPHFLLSVLLTEWLLGRQPRKQAAFFWIPFGLGLLLPVLVIVSISSASLTGMARDAALVANTYSHLGRRSVLDLVQDRWAIVAFICVAAGVMGIRSLRDGDRLPDQGARAMIAVMSLNLAFVFIQGKGLAYHWIPSIGLGFLICAWAIADLPRAHVRRPGIAAIIFIFGYAAVNSRELLRPYQPPFSFHRLIHDGEKVMVFSTSVWAIRPLYLDGATLTGPWFMHFALPALIKDPVDQHDRALLNSMRDDIQARLRVQAPELLVFEEPEHWFLEDGQTISGLIAKAGIVIPSSYTELSEHDLLKCCGGRHGWRIYARRN